MRPEAALSEHLKPASRERVGCLAKDYDRLFLSWGAVILKALLLPPQVT